MHGWFWRFQHRSVFEHDLFAYSSMFEYGTEQHLNSRDETRLLPNTVLDVLCWAEDNCMPEIREQGDCCPEAEERDISLCPSDWDSLSLLFGAKRMQDKCKASCCIFFQPHPVDLSHAYFIKHTEDAESLIGGGVVSWLDMFGAVGVRDLNISRNSAASAALHSSHRRWM